MGVLSGIGGRWTRKRASLALTLLTCALGLLALSLPTVAQEEIPYRYRPPNLLERIFGREEPPVNIQRQPVRPRRPLLERLFGGGTEEPPPAVIQRAPSSKAKTRRSTMGEVVRVEEPEALPKADAARTVLVVGDFMASGLSEGLLSAYSQNPNIKIIERSNGSSGLVRNEFYNWPNEIKTLLDTEKPAAVVIMLGANDRQQLKVADTREPPLSDSWIKEYQARTDALVGVLKERKVPFAWVGMPAFKSPKVSSDLLAFNDIYRKSAEQAGGVFVDVWDGFVDENGAFIMNGPDMNGQAVRLRGPDGVSLSKAGKRKLAFFVEKPLNKLLGNEAATPGLASPQSVGPAAPANINVDRTAPMAIDDPEIDGGQVLLGSKPEPKVETRTVAEKLVVEGIASAAAPGRADDFGGAAPAAASASAPAAVAAGVRE
ncbi:DUF459 domain-containing protein [Mesorhizobium sp. BAC0120]|uniref:SGNH/GDSL hydrolase family protein n=1 Tax=Mesorhizobium sp. BAC0120 TaxID=3090670 RepID=UPI00298C9BF6|nr:DUF459 domain-containing protein [Mesorhizobium sp. BAC0120]MDW6025045.1 DUF459 domain-containing protein [Mesorhizobium sp. BAC0120]